MVDALPQGATSAWPGPAAARRPSLGLFQRAAHGRGRQGFAAGRAGLPVHGRWPAPGAGSVQPALPDRGAPAHPQHRRDHRRHLPRAPAGARAASARAAVRPSLLPAGPCRGRRPAGAGGRPVRGRPGLPAQQRRHGGARGRVAGRARPPAGAAGRGPAQRQPGARARRPADRGQGRQGRAHAADRDRGERSDVPRRSARRPEDRLVFRSAREPRLRGAFLPRRARARPVQLQRGLRPGRARGRG